MNRLNNKLLFSAAFFFLNCAMLSPKLILADENVDKSRDLINQGKYEEAIQFLQTLPDSNEKKLSLAFAYLQTEKYDLAEDCLLQVVKESPDSLPARYSLAMLYEKKKNNPEALSQWEKVLLLAHKKELKNLATKHITQLKKQ
ncbi:MAG: tetratricopeptide repeat protein [Elusimicrobia bacterium]|nr:tetratricopeptide repeat protein [Elusimicrobiota bacterium]MBU2614290.1 tetratricopeptide repeat protein [Elusimicrobiota bacterium]